MKRLLILTAILASGITLHAQSKTIVVDTGTTETVTGVGGYASIAYAFAKGDKVAITGHATKQLERMKIVIFPGTPIGQLKFTKSIDYSFTMSEAGICVFTFISDRGGKNAISYNVTRTPASAATEDYVTKVVWDKPTDKAGVSTPHQAGK